MKIDLRLIVTMLFEIVYMYKMTLASGTCGKTITTLEAQADELTLLSSDYTESLTGEFKCAWIIYSTNSSQVIQVKMAQIFSGPASSCSSDYILLRDGWTSTGQPLRVWCKGSPTGSVVTSFSNAVYVELVVSTYDSPGLIFIMSYSASTTKPSTSSDDGTEVNSELTSTNSVDSFTDQVITGPVELNVINFCLLALSIVIVLSIVIGIVILIKREIKRHTEAKEVKFKQMLRVRRKGISGISGVGNTDFKVDDSSSERSERDFEDTSFTVVSVTPTSEYDTSHEV